MTKSSGSIALLAACVLAAATATVSAQGYPTRSITVVVPFPAGGPSDVVARIVTDHMGRTLGHQLVIENVGGAGGTLGSARVAAAAPDGYTLLAGSMGSHVAAPVLTPNLKYDPSQGLRADRLHRAFAGGDRGAQGLSRQGHGRVRRLCEAERRQGEAGAWRHRRLLAHGVPAVQRGARPQADAGRLSRHRPGGERSGRRPRRFPVRAVGERGRADQGRQRRRPTGSRLPSAWRRCPTSRPPRRPGSNTT